jgi:hypothetical protein
VVVATSIAEALRIVPNGSRIMHTAQSPITDVSVLASTEAERIVRDSIEAVKTVHPLIGIVTATDQSVGVSAPSGQTVGNLGIVSRRSRDQI